MSSIRAIFIDLNGWIFQGFVAVIGWTTKYQNQIAITIFPITSTTHIIMIIILLLTLLWVMTLLLYIVIVLTYDWMRALGQCRFGLVGWLDTGRFFAQQHFKLTLTGQGVGGVHTIMMDDEGGDDGGWCYLMNIYMVAMLQGLLWVACIQRVS